MSHCKVFEPVSEIEMLKRRVAQLERLIEEIRSEMGTVPQWCPPVCVDVPYWLNAPQANVVHQ